MTQITDTSKLALLACECVFHAMMGSHSTG